jgi:hypothetical protein
MFTVDVAVTCAALTVNVALVRPAGTTTLLGAVASTVLLLARVTTAFPVGAAARSVTVAVDEAGPMTAFGLNVTDETARDTTRNTVVLTVVPPEEADTFTPVVCVTGWVLAVKSTLVWPAGTVTLAGTVTSEVLPLASATAVPPLGAAPFNVTVPVPGVPPGTLPANETCASSGNSVMSVADVVPLNDAEIRTFVVAVTELVAIANDAVVCPAGTETLAGIVTGTVPVPPFENAFVSVTVAPPDGAAADSLTVPVADLPPTRSTGLVDTALMPAAPPAVMISSACCPGLPGRSAKMFMLNCDVCGDVLIVKLALVAPAGTVTLDGIVATLAGAGVESAIAVAPLCGPLSVTVPTDDCPPTTLAGLTATPESTGGGGDARTVSTRLKL